MRNHANIFYAFLPEKVIIWRQNFCFGVIRNKSRFNLLVVDELGRPPDERNKLVVVQGPDSLRSGGFHPVNLLQLSNKLQVPAE